MSPIPKPPAFWGKLLGLAITGFCGVLTTTLPQIARGDYSGVFLALGMSALVALAYSLDPNHASASADQIRRSILDSFSAVETNVPAAAKVVGGNAVDAFAHALAEKLADQVGAIQSDNGLPSADKQATVARLVDEAKALLVKTQS